MLYLGEHKWVVALRERLGINKPEWFVFGDGSYEDWKTNTRKNHPVGWFLTETAPNWIQRAHEIITSPYYDTRYYIRNRFYRRTHVLRTDCPPGQYWDTDERILSAMANAIIDFVEVELAFKHKWCGSDDVPNAVWKNGRCPELGLKYLEWEMTLDDPALDEYSRADSQAKTSREIKVIYDWAKARPDRPDPMEVSGWSEFCAKYPGLWRKQETPEQAAESAVALKKVREIEDQYNQEDEDMLIRIIKIRRSLWT